MTMTLPHNFTIKIVKYAGCDPRAKRCSHRSHSYDDGKVKFLNFQLESRSEQIVFHLFFYQSRIQGLQDHASIEYSREPRMATEAWPTGILGCCSVKDCGCGSVESLSSLYIFCESSHLMKFSFLVDRSDKVLLP